MRRSFSSLLTGLLGIAGAAAAWEAPRDPLFPGAKVVYSIGLGNPELGGPMIAGGGTTDKVNALAVDAAGNVYLAGVTYAKAFPKRDPEPPSIAPSSAGFVAKLRADARDFQWVRIFQGFYVQAMAVDASGNVVVAGSGYFGPPELAPSRIGPSGFSDSDSLVVKLDASGSRVLFAVLVGGSGHDYASAVALDAAGNVYLAGHTRSADFPVTRGAFQETRRTSEYTPFVCKLNPTGGALVFSTYLGGSASDDMTALAVDARGSAHLAGFTTSADFPITPGALQPRLAPGENREDWQDGFVVALNPAGSGLLFSTFLGGSKADRITGLALDAAGNLYLTGYTFSADFPVTCGAFITSQPYSMAAFVSKLNPSATTLLYSTYFGGSAQANAIAVDRGGNAYITGSTNGGMPLWSAVQPAYYGGTCYSYTPSGSLPIGQYRCPDAFAAALDQSGSGLLFSTYLSGYGRKAGLAVVADAQGNVYLGGYGSVQLSDPHPLSSGGGALLIKLAPGSKPPLFLRHTITNGANFQWGLPLPGGLASIFALETTGVTGLVRADSVPLPFELAGFSVKIDGLPAPLHSVSNSGGVVQINLQVPFEVEAPESRVEVTQHGATASILGVENYTTAPEIFMVDGIHGAIQHGADHRLVTPAAPAAPGEVVLVYATGLGPVTPAVASGSPAPATGLSRTVLKPTAFIGARPAEVLFSGLAPGSIGLYQLNVRVPEDAPAGDLDMVVGLPPVTVRYYLYSSRQIQRLSRAVKIPVR